MRANIARSRIRLNVFGYIIQRACRKAEDDRREGKAFQNAPETDEPTPPTSFTDVVRVVNSRCIRGMSPSSDSSTDELSLDPPTGVSKSSKPKEHPNTQASKTRLLRKPSSIQQQITQTSPRHGVSVVIPPKGRAATGITALENSKRKQSGSRVGSSTTIRSTQNHDKGASRRGPQVSNPSRTTMHQMISAKVAKSSVKGRANLTENSTESQLLHDRSELGIQLLILLECPNPGRQEIAKLQKFVGHIDMMAVKYFDELRKALGNEYDKYQRALGRWIACMRTLVGFRETNGLSGDGPSMLAGFRTLPPEKKARRPYLEIGQEIFKWQRDGMTLPVFCEEVGTILLEMASFAPLGMELEELLVDLTPFTAGLVECFLPTPHSP